MNVKEATRVGTRLTRRGGLRRVLSAALQGVYRVLGPQASGSLVPLVTSGLAAAGLLASVQRQRLSSFEGRAIERERVLDGDPLTFDVLR